MKAYDKAAKLCSLSKLFVEFIIRMYACGRRWSKGNNRDDLKNTRAAVKNKNYEIGKSSSQQRNGAAYYYVLLLN